MQVPVPASIPMRGIPALQFHHKTLVGSSRLIQFLAVDKKKNDSRRRRIPGSAQAETMGRSQWLWTAST